jgi:hypothetical protein
VSPSANNPTPTANSPPIRESRPDPVNGRLPPGGLAVDVAPGGTVDPCGRTGVVVVVVVEPRLCTGDDVDVVPCTVVVVEPDGLVVVVISTVVVVLSGAVVAVVGTLVVVSGAELVVLCGFVVEVVECGAVVEVEVS